MEVGSIGYDLVRTLHVISVISWMAGMLYLPRLFVYHCGAEKGSVQSETFKTMERKLLKIIINPAMIVAWLTGLYMAWVWWNMAGWWLISKLILVLIMSAVHGFYSKYVRMFAADTNDKSEKFWRIMNEAPAVLMIFIVFLVIVKPF